VLLSHPTNKTTWRLTRQAFPWHELLTAFTWAFLVLHVVLLAVDPYADVGWLGSLVPGLSTYRPAAIAIGTVALYALLVTTVTARWTRLLPPGWWLRIHRVSAVAFALAWVHGVLAGTDGGVLTPFYLVTGLVVGLAVAHRWWTVRAATVRPRPVAAGAAVAGRES
jgi:DMSO/TMAO reductase YedYZ heme-binding membrane subunit